MSVMSELISEMNAFINEIQAWMNEMKALIFVTQSCISEMNELMSVMNAFINGMRGRCPKLCVTCSGGQAVSEHDGEVGESTGPLRWFLPVHLCSLNG